MFTLAVVLCTLWRGAAVPCSEALQSEVIYNITTGRGYDRKEVAVDLEGGSAEISAQLVLTDLVKIDDVQQTFTVIGYLRSSWTDTRLIFSDLGMDKCFKFLQFPLTGNPARPYASDAIWDPTVHFTTALQSSYGSWFYMLFPPGTIYKSVQFSGIFSCATMNFAAMPFDVQECYVPIVTSAKDISVIPKDGQPIELPFGNIETPAWVLDSYSDASPTRDSLTIRLAFRRRWSHFILTDFVYCVAIVCMTWSGFFLDHNAPPARVTIAVIPVLTMLNRMNVVMALTPRIATVTWLDTFQVVSLWFTVVGVLEYGLVQVLMHLLKQRSVQLTVLRDLVQELTGVHKGEGRLPLQRAVLQTAIQSFQVPTQPGQITRHTLRSGLHKYGCYYSAEQVDEVFLRMGIGEESHMDRGMLVQFLDKFPQPTPVMSVKFRETPLPLKVDAVMRVGFPLAYCATLAALWSRAATLLQ